MSIQTGSTQTGSTQTEAGPVAFTLPVNGQLEYLAANDAPLAGPGLPASLRVEGLEVLDADITVNELVPQTNYYRQRTLSLAFAPHILGWWAVKGGEAADAGGEDGRMDLNRPPYTDHGLALAAKALAHLDGLFARAGVEAHRPASNLRLRVPGITAMPAPPPRLARDGGLRTWRRAYAAWMAAFLAERQAGEAGEVAEMEVSYPTASAARLADQVSGLLAEIWRPVPLVCALTYAPGRSDLSVSVRVPDRLRHVPLVFRRIGADLRLQAPANPGQAAVEHMDDVAAAHCLAIALALRACLVGSEQGLTLTAIHQRAIHQQGIHQQAIHQQAGADGVQEAPFLRLRVEPDGWEVDLATLHGLPVREARTARLGAAGFTAIERVFAPLASGEPIFPSEMESPA